LACAPTTAEKVCALTLGGCRWPYGDPRHPDFHFCGAPVVREPYCEQHRAMAYLALRGHGAHGRQSAHGRLSPPPGSRAALLGHAQLPA
jgi:GcrA cell cycle regulator